MYDVKKDRIEQLRVKFEEEKEKRSPEARQAAREYLHALSDFVRTYDGGPAGDPVIARIDTTGE